MEAVIASNYRVREWLVLSARRELVGSAGILAPRAKVFELLLLLIERRDRVVTRDELLNELWGGRAVAENSLPQCVIELRKLLGDDARSPTYIQTIPKVGYRLIAPVEEELAPEPVAESPAPTRPAWRSPWVVAVVLAASVAALFVATPRIARPRPLAAREAAWWKLDRDGAVVADASGSGLTGAAPASAEWITGAVRGAVRLNGVSGGIVGPYRGQLPASGESRTVTLWMRTSLPFVEAAGLFQYGSGFRGRTLARFGMGLTDNAHAFVGSATEEGAVTGQTRMDDGIWHLLVGTYESASGMTSLYVDGKLQASGKVVAPQTDAQGEWWIGHLLSGQSMFRGAIDDVRVYRFAFRPAQQQALYRCASRRDDAGGYYFLPVWEPTQTILDTGEIANFGKDGTGIQLARASGDCSLESLKGADAGQDLRMSVDLLAPTDAEGRLTNAGVYFRSRQASPGDGFVGGTSAGYWVQLYSTGMIKIKRLNPWAVVAFSPPIAGFDASRFHRLEIEARGEALGVRLDGQTATFRQGDRTTAAVSIPPSWEGPPTVGRNEGAAGVAFWCEEDRGLIGGQRARDFHIERLDAGRQK
jgi:DNA-binding winged helix-turn-helix (wHTH) protein